MDSPGGKEHTCAVSAAAPESETPSSKMDMETEIEQVLDFLAVPLAEEIVVQDTQGATRQVRKGYWEKFCDRVLQGKIEPRCIIDFAYTDAGNLNLTGNARLLERAYCFADTCDSERGWRQLVVHVHTLVKWVEATSTHPRERAKSQITSVNVRHANRVEINGMYKQEHGGESFCVVPVDRKLRSNWRQYFQDGNFAQIQWETHSLKLPQGEDSTDSRVKDTYKCVRDVIALGDSLFTSHSLPLAWTTADSVFHCNKLLTNAPLNQRGPLQYQVVAYRKKLIESTLALGAGAGVGLKTSVTTWTEPNRSELNLNAPHQAPLPFKILFVGVNSSEQVDLNLKKEFAKIGSAFREEFDKCKRQENSSLKQISYSTWKEVMDEVGQEYPSILHFGCHAQASGLELFCKTVQPEKMIPVIKAHNEFARENEEREINLIIVNACQSDKHAEKFSKCVDFAIGHKAPIGDTEAIDFTDSFYRNMFKRMHLQGSFDTAQSMSSEGYQLHAAKKDARQLYLVVGNDGNDGLRSKHRRGDDRSASNFDGKAHDGESSKTSHACTMTKTAHGELKSNLQGKTRDCGEGSSSGTPPKRQRSDLVPDGDSSFATKQQKLDLDHQHGAGHGVGEGAVMGDISAVADCNKSSLRGAFPYDIFISHSRDKDDAGRDNHARAKRLKDSLERLGFKLWFDDEQKRDNILQRTAKGIEGSAVILICVTKRYMEDVAKYESNTCRREFEYALNKRDTLNMLPIIMEESMANTSQWHGSLNITLGQYRCEHLTTDVNFDDAVKALAVVIRRMIEPEVVFANEQQGAARQMISRSQSPASSSVSRLDTPSPWLPSPQGQDVLAMHLNNDVGQFRDDMKQFMQSFLQSGDEPAPRKWKLCELLLVAFMRDKVAPSCNSVISENLEAWQGKCEDPDENLIDCFHDMMQVLQPPIFKELEYDFAIHSKQNHTSIFVIDWMVRHSAWALFLVKQAEWAKKIVLEWFEPENEDTSDCLLDRAETFLQKGVKGISWGAKILGKVIQTNSYTIFFRMGPLCSLLLQEHCALERRRHMQQVMEVDCTSECTPLLSMSLLVSSSQWHLSLTDDKSLSATHVSDISWRLQRIASLPQQLLEANECSLSKIEFVEWKPLYSLVLNKKNGKFGGGGGVSDGDDNFGGGGGGGGGGAGGAVTGERGRNEVSLKKLFEAKHVFAEYLEELENNVGFSHDPASGGKMRVEEESISLKFVHFESGSSRCEADPQVARWILQEDMLCPIDRTMMQDPVKCFEGSTSRHFTLSRKSFGRSAIENVLKHAQEKGEDARSPWTRKVLKTEQIDGRLQLVLQPDKEMLQKIQTLLEENRKRETEQKHKAEGEEERRNMLMRMGYTLDIKGAESMDHFRTTASAQELLGRLSKGDFMCVIGPPASGKTLTMLQVSQAIAISWLFAARLSTAAHFEVLIFYTAVCASAALIR